MFVLLVLKFYWVITNFFIKFLSCHGILSNFCVLRYGTCIYYCDLLHGLNLSVDSNLQVERSSHLCYNFSVAFLFAGIHVSVRYYPKRYCKGAVPMLHKTCPNSFHCPVEATLQLIGGKYKTLILWHLIDQTLRFNELQKLLPQATPKMLTQQLRELETDPSLITLSDTEKRINFATYFVSLSKRIQ